MKEHAKVALLSALPKEEIIDLLYMSYRQCNSSKDLKRLQHEAYNRTEAEKCDFINQCVKSGHTSPLAHIQFVFHIENINRACSHQLVRHAVGTAYSHQSLRYTSPDVDKDDWFDTPDIIENNPELLSSFQKAISRCARSYKELSSKLPVGKSKEVARKVLPMATTSNIVVSMNLRTLLNFLGERMCTHAEDDIRDIATQISHIVKEHVGIYLLSNKLAPKCIQLGACLEAKSCGVRISLDDLLRNHYDIKEE